MWLMDDVMCRASNQHRLPCSYNSDVDIDAEVNPAITAGVKGLKVSVFLILMCPLHESVLTALVKKTMALDLTVPGDAESHFRASYWSSTAGGRSHLLFHSPPCECSDMFSRSY